MKFPVIVIYGKCSFAQGRKGEFGNFIGKLSSPNILKLKGAARERYRASAIIDFEGKYYEVIPVKLKRAWLAKLAPICDLTSMDCVLAEGRVLTVGELQQMAKQWKNVFARSFRKFLVQQDPNMIFDAKMFRQAWEHSYIELPEEEWGEDAFS